jgi:hypothetical protein
MLTRKDFIKAAKSVSEIVNPWEQRKQYEFFLKWFREDNPRFDSSRFEQACELKSIKKS